MVVMEAVSGKLLIREEEETVAALVGEQYTQMVIERKNHRVSINRVLVLESTENLRINGARIMVMMDYLRVER
jgi:hypothetical protein